DFIDAGGIDFESEEIENFLNDDSIPFGVEEPPFNTEEDILFLESLLREDPIPPHPINLNQTKLPVQEPNHSLKMGYEHFNTKDVVESSTKNLIPIPNECMVVSENGNEEVDAVGDLRVDNVIQNSEHEYSESEDSDFDNLLLLLPPPEPPDKEFDFKKENVIVKFKCIEARLKFDVFNDKNDVLSYFMFAKEFCLLSAESEDTIFDPGISD
nr:hypothetical protein [Tanacetum cinerariifolium]